VYRHTRNGDSFLSEEHVIAARAAAVHSRPGTGRGCPGAGGCLGSYGEIAIIFQTSSSETLMFRRIV